MGGSVDVDDEFAGVRWRTSVGFLHFALGPVVLGEKRYLRAWFSP
jgi:hypothetical protein